MNLHSTFNTFHNKTVSLKTNQSLIKINNLKYEYTFNDQQIKIDRFNGF